MEAGYYRAGIRKLRQLYAKKLRATLDAFRKYSGIAEPINTESGLNLIVRVRTEKPMSVLSDEARSVGVVANPMVPVTSGPHKNSLIFYYSLIPLGSIEKAIGDMVQLWKS